MYAAAQSERQKEHEAGSIENRQKMCSFRLALLYDILQHPKKYLEEIS